MDGKWGSWRMLPLAVVALIALYWRFVVGAAAIALLVLALSGCETIPEVVEIRVPISVPCEVEKPTRPRMDTDHLPLDAKVDVQNRAMRAEIDRREAYEGQLRTALDVCTTPIFRPSGVLP